MNYEEKYKQALERALKLRAQNPFDTVSQMMEHIFPELRESEDERTRKEILYAIRKLDDKTTIYGINYDYKKWIAWLEKQGEQKPTPKFKIGDTIHKIGENTVFPRTIEKIEDGDYVCNNSHSFINIKFQDDYELVEQKPSWNEEEEEMIDFMIEFIESLYWRKDLTKRKDEVLSWLKSIKPNHWKPSEQNIKDLEWCADLVKDKMGVGFHRLQVFIDELKSL